MENTNIRIMSLYLDTDIYIVPGEKLDFVQSDRLLDLSTLQNQESSEAIDEIPGLEFEGGFEKGILVVLEEGEMKTDLKEMLFNLFGALHCSLKDMAIVKADQIEGLPMERITNLGPSKVIVFGLVRHDLMTFQKNKYEIVQEDGIEYLFADALGLIADNKELKKTLWKEIQVLFNIKK